MSILFYFLLKVYVRHPELAAAKENRDYVLKQVCEAINTISDVAQGKTLAHNMMENAYEGPGELAAALDDFDVRIYYSLRHFHLINVFLSDFRVKNNREVSLYVRPVR